MSFENYVMTNNRVQNDLGNLCHEWLWEHKSETSFDRALYAYLLVASKEYVFAYQGSVVVSKQNVDNLCNLIKANLIKGFDRTEIKALCRSRFHDTLSHCKSIKKFFWDRNNSKILIYVDEQKTTRACVVYDLLEKKELFIKAENVDEEFCLQVCKALGVNPEYLVPF